MEQTYTLQALLRDLGWREPLAGAEGVPLGGVAIDSRRVRPGDIFVALPGERTDGHAYVEDAFHAGAAVALVSREVPGRPAVDLVTGEAPSQCVTPLAIRVPSTLAALQQAARARREAYPALRVIGVTGSVGKTTTKEAIFAVLAQHYRVLRSSGNQNNEIGLPLTLLELTAEHDRAVLEMGMYALGEIEMLCRLARPQVGVVTNVGPVHLERLGTIERIAQAKAELLAALPAGGVAVLNGDDPLVMAMPCPAGVRRLTYGRGEGNAVRATHVSSRGLEGVRFTVGVEAVPELGIAAGQCALSAPTPGAHTVMPALAAVAVGLLEGLTWDEIAAGLGNQAADLRLVPRRAQGGATLLDDTYNASPASMLAALDLLEEIPGRHVAVLGDMLELGPHEEEGHRQVGARAAQVLDLLVTVGPRAARLADEARRRGLPPEAVHSVMEVEEAVRLLPELVREGDVLLVKGSRSVGLEGLVAAIAQRAE